eukprot:1482508-Amphidinium_carterae.2
MGGYGFSCCLRFGGGHMRAFGPKLVDNMARQTVQQADAGMSSAGSVWGIGVNIPRAMPSQRRSQRHVASHNLL